MAGLHHKEAPRARHPMPGRGGFTLVEMLLVVFLIGIVAMLTVPMIGTAVRDAALSNATTDIVATLEYARDRAAATGMDMRVRFPRDGDRVLVERRVPATNLLDAVGLVSPALIEDGVFEPVPHPLEKHTNGFVVVSTDDDGPRITVAEFGGTNVVVFGALGAPSSGGLVKLAYRESVRVIGVAAGTGKITIVE